LPVASPGAKAEKLEGRSPWWH